MILYNTSKDIYDFLSFVVFFTASTDQVTVEMNAENITINEGGIGIVVGNVYITGKHCSLGVDHIFLFPQQGVPLFKFFQHQRGCFP